MMCGLDMTSQGFVYGMFLIAGLLYMRGELDIEHINSLYKVYDLIYC